MLEFSIITVSFNSEKTISETIKSIKSQTFQNFEYIIIDGGSKDSTVQVAMEKLKGMKNFNIISEPDEGIYDAMNKGLALVRGKIISILNSDDIYFNEKVLEEVVKCFNNNIDIVYGNTYVLNSKRKIVRNINPGTFKKGFFYWGWFPSHPSTFVKRSVYDKIGNFNDKLQIAADFDFLLRAIELYNFKVFYLDQPLVIMRQGGKSTNSLKNVIKGINECKLAFKINKLPLNPFYSIFRISRILNQYLRTFLLKRYMILNSRGIL